MREILCILAMVAACFPVSIANASPVTDWVKSQETILAKVMAATEERKIARCGMQTDKEAQTACLQAFDVAKYFDETLKVDLDNIARVDRTRNPKLRKQLVDAGVIAYNKNVDAGTARLQAIDDIFNHIVTAER